MAKLFANSGDSDQMPHSAASDLGLHCLPITLLRVSRLQCVKSACAATQSNQSCHVETLCRLISKMHPVKILIRPCECPG